MNRSARHRNRPSDACRYVALGEAFTEGVGDDDQRLPNGVRGWADRVAEGLAAAAPGWEYANLAVRSRRFGAVEAEQLPAAVDIRPTLASVSVGARDILVAPAPLDQLLERYDAVVDTLVRTGATVMLFTQASSPASGGSDDRAFRFDETVRRIGRERGAVVIDPWGERSFRAARLWAAGGAQLSRTGHAQLARHILDVLGVAPTDRTGDHPSAPVTAGRAASVSPGRLLLRLAASPSRARPAAVEAESLGPRWPVPVVVPARGGLRELVRAHGDAKVPVVRHLVR